MQPTNILLQNEVSQEFLKACALGDYAQVDNMFKDPLLNANVTDKDGCTGLFIASREGHVRVVENITKWMDTRYVDVNLCNKNGDTPLCVAASEGRKNEVNILLSCGAKHDLSNKLGWTPLMHASYYGHSAVVMMLISKGAALNAVSNAGCSALYSAANAGRLETVKVLLQSGASVDQPSNDMRTPLSIAARWGRADVVRALLEGGADPAKSNTDRWTPLMYAVQYGHIDTVNELLSYRPPALTQNYRTTAAAAGTGAGTAARTATAEEEEEVRHLNALAHWVNTTDRLTGQTALHIAVATGTEENNFNIGIIEALLKGGADKALLVGTAGIAPIDTCSPPKKGSGTPFRPEKPPKKRFSNKEEFTASFKAHSAELMKLQPQLQAMNIVANDVATSFTKECQHSHADTPNSVLSSSSSSGLSAEMQLQFMINLQSLATASPQTIVYLAQFGDAAARAEHEYVSITRDPTLNEYYSTFLGAVSKVVLASQTISSGMVSDARESTAEVVLGVVDTAIGLTGFFLLPLITGFGKFLLQIPNDRERAETIERITTFFPSIDSHKFLEILARQLTLRIRETIKNVLRQAKYVEKKSIYGKALQAVEWLKSKIFDSLPPVAALATLHAAVFLEHLMRGQSLEPQVVTLELIPELMDLIDVKGYTSARKMPEESQLCKPVPVQQLLTIQDGTGSNTSHLSNNHSSSRNNNNNNNHHHSSSSDGPGSSPARTADDKRLIHELETRLERQEEERLKLARKVSDLSRKTKEISEQASIAAAAAQAVLNDDSSKGDDGDVCISGTVGSKGGKGGHLSINASAAARSKANRSNTNGKVEVEEAERLRQQQQRWQTETQDAIELLVLELQMLKENAEIFHSSSNFSPQRSTNSDISLSVSPPKPGISSPNEKRTAEHEEQLRQLFPPPLSLSPNTPGKKRMKEQQQRRQQQQQQQDRRTHQAGEEAALELQQNDPPVFPGVDVGADMCWEEDRTGEEVRGEERGECRRGGEGYNHRHRHHQQQQHAVCCVVS